VAERCEMRESAVKEDPHGSPTRLGVRGPVRVRCGVKRSEADALQRDRYGKAIAGLGRTKVCDLPSTSKPGTRPLRPSKAGRW